MPNHLPLLPLYLATDFQGEIPWGGEGLGEFVAARTYQRLKADGVKETWPEATLRAVNGAQLLADRAGFPYTEQELHDLWEMHLELRAFLPGRMLWVGGTALVEDGNIDALMNCLAGETGVITRQGRKSLVSLAGSTAEILTRDGNHYRWQVSEIKKFGVQKLLAVNLRRGPNKRFAARTVYSTAEHNWFTRNGERTTASLTPGDQIPFGKATSGYKAAHISPQGIQHGLVWGDGSLKATRSAEITLCGGKDRELLKWFPANPTTEVIRDGEWVGTRVVALPGYYKTLPSLDESTGYLYSWLAGYFAADGHCRKNHVDLASASRESIDFAQTVADILGIATRGIFTQCRVGYGTEPTDIYTLSFFPGALTEDFFLVTKHRDAWASSNMEIPSDWFVESIEETDREEEVYCAVVPDTHNFVLADNILTANCWHVSLRQPADFGWVMERLMVGGGVGFRINEAENLPPVLRSQVTHVSNPAEADYVVPDTREGWADLITRVVEAYTTGQALTYSTYHVRPAGMPLKRFGGFASGPGVLVEGIEDISRILDRRSDMYMRPVDALDICNIIGRVVVAGSSRRSAQIALGSPFDPEYLGAKRWADGDLPGWRSNSNNTVLASSYEEIPESFWQSYYDGGGEPYGLANVELARRCGRLGEERYDSTITGFNPCAEATLGDREPCMLATLVLPRLRTWEEAVHASTLLYRFQKAAVSGWHHDPATHLIMQRNRRIGQNVTGVLSAYPDKHAWLDPLYDHLSNLDQTFSAVHGLPVSVRLTVIQPGGTLPLLPGVSAGIHPAYAHHYIRRVMVGVHDPLAEHARAKGLNVVPKVGLDGQVDPTHMVVEFPCADTGRVTSEVGAIEQLEIQKWANTVWADQAVSVTVSYKPSELDEIRSWLAANYSTSVKSVSFLRFEDHGFAQPPYETVTKAEYECLRAQTQSVSLVDELNELTVDACAGACPIR